MNIFRIVRLKFKKVLPTTVAVFIILYFIRAQTFHQRPYVDNIPDEAFRTNFNSSPVSTRQRLSTKTGFQEVIPGRMWVYSAYLDYRTTPPLVRVFGLIDKMIFRTVKFKLLFYTQSDISQDCKGDLVDSLLTSVVINLDPFHSNTR